MDRHDSPELTAGLDEAGRGCLAGPVVAAAVILPQAYDLPGLTDSKRITPAGRSRLASAISGQALAWALGLSWPREIERLNILQASLAAMRRAVKGLKTEPSFLVVDGLHPVPMNVPQKAMVKADAHVPVVSAASILAKWHRDRLMLFLDRRYPGYGLARHKGYPTARHLDALSRLGPSRIHRLSFHGVLPGKGARMKQLCLPGT